MVEINPLLNAETAFNLLTPFGLIFLLLIGFWYVLPRLYKQDIYGAITPILLFSTLRYLALGFIVPGLSNGFEAPLSPTRPHKDYGLRQELSRWRRR